MGGTSTKIFKKGASAFSSVTGAGHEEGYHPQNFERTFKGSPFVLIRHGSMYFDEDGDLAHEFYVEVLPQGKRGRPTMRRVTESLQPEGIVPLPYPRLHMITMRRKMKRKTVIVGLLTCLTLWLLDYFGAFTHFFERTYDDNFQYPYNGNVPELISQLRNHELPDVPTITSYNYTFLSDCKKKCIDEDNPQLRLVFLIKSAVHNFEQRKAIRNSWGFERRFSDVPVRTVFLLGVDPNNTELQRKILVEQSKYGDIVQADFIDVYYNNTIKTMMGFRWIMENCLNSKFYMFSDDDMYISTKNVLKFLRDPTSYPDLKGSLRGTDYELPDDVKLFSGFVFISAPHRHRSSKWYVPLSEYPYHLWPPYVTAGAYILSKEALIDMYYASMYTQHFRLDDIYLGLVAKKAGIEPYHCSEFHFYQKPYDINSYRFVIASHGFNPEELVRIWNEQKTAGHA
ncbi:Beta-1,3-galactosyltransferase brn [Frankliniella fusca]|uniref:Hexosyltransferase n=1 Tax=Frankliniella fusca TaxID=407009 RepID=A0AAE1I260_9NEOP|nr:Beta-1,3-galactosyltransferase brn [Frankliniella fusca]